MIPVATGLPWTWDEIAPGHLVIAQEALDYGWWEAIVIGRNGDIFAAVSGLPEATQVCAPSNRNRVDELSDRITAESPLARAESDRPEPLNHRHSHPNW